MESFSEKMKFDTAIIILNWNGKDLLRNCINSIMESEEKNYKIFVVDNGSNDDSLQSLNNKNLEIIRDKKNEGFVGGNNIGMKKALKENKNLKYFLLLNNDTLVKKNWLTYLKQSAEKEKRRGVIGAKQYNFQGKKTISSGNFGFFGVKYFWEEKFDKEVDWVSGACFLVKKEVIDKIGFLGELYQPIYYEETDFETRAKNAGYKIIYCPKSEFLHLGGSDTKNEPEKFSSIFYRNRFIYFYKNNPFYLFSRIPADIFRGIKQKNLKNIFRAYLDAIKRMRDFKKKT